MAAPRIATLTTRPSYRPLTLFSRCRTRSTECSRSLIGLGTRGYGQTYADTLSTEFSARRQVDYTIPLRTLRTQERQILTTSRAIRPSDALEPLSDLTHTALDTLDRLPSDASQAQSRQTILRCAFRTFIRHPLGIPYARRLLARSDVHLDSDVLGRLIRRFRYAEVNDEAWALPFDNGSHREAFHGFLGDVLTRLRTLEPETFTQIMDIHIDNGMSVDALTTLINQCMAFSHRFNGRWTPAAWQVIIQAYRRDGDIQGCIKTYQAFRESQTGDDEWERYIASTVSWPYEALLAACTDRSPLLKGRFRAPADMPEVIWRDMQIDGVDPPPRLVAHLIKLARENRDSEAGRRLWEAYPRGDIDCFYQYLRLVREAPGIPLRPLVRRIIEDKIVVNQTVPRVHALWSQALLAALAPPRNDFPLALYLLDRLTLDEFLIDTTATLLLRYSKSRPRGADWWRSVWNASPPPTRHAPLGIRSRNARGRGVTGTEWDLISRRLRDLGGADVTLPLSRPLARWDRVGDLYGTKIAQSGKVDMAPLKRGLVAVLERCVMGRPKVGVVYPGATPRAALRAAKEGVYRDLFGK